MVGVPIGDRYSEWYLRIVSVQMQEEIRVKVLERFKLSRFGQYSDDFVPVQAQFPLHSYMDGMNEDIGS